MEKKSANVIDVKGPNTTDVSERSAQWVAALITLIGLLFFTLVLTLAKQPEEPIMRDKVTLHIASSDRDDIQSVT